MSLLHIQLYAQPSDHEIFYKSSLFSEDLENTRVVFLGEPTHQEGNVFEYRHQICKWLYEEKGFDIIAFESGFYSLSTQLSSTTFEDQESYRRFLEDAIFPIWINAEEFQPMLNWMIEEKDSLKVLGFDNQLTSTGSYYFLIEELQIFDEKEEIDWSLFEKVLISAINSTIPKEIDFKLFLKDIKKLRQTLKRNRALVKGEPQAVTKLNFLIQSLESIEALTIDCYKNDAGPKKVEEGKISDHNPRDLQMAKNLLFLLEQYPDSKIICWGASPHFAKGFGGTSNEELKSFHPMGEHVVSALGEEQVKSFTFTSAQGSYKFWLEEDSTRIPKPPKGSFENVLSETVQGSKYISLRQDSAWKEQHFVSQLMAYTLVTANWSTVFDGVFYLDSITPVHAKRYFVEEAEKEIEEDSLVLDYPYQIEGGAQKLVSQKKRFILNQSMEGQRTFFGKIIDQETGEGIPSVLINSIKGNYGTISDLKGTYTFTLLASDDSVRFSSVGYEPQVFKMTELPKTVILQHSTLMLGEVSITDKMRSAKAIFRKAVNHIRRNYNSKPYNMTFFGSIKAYNFGEPFADIDYYAQAYNVFKKRFLDFEIQQKRENFKDIDIIKRTDSRLKNPQWIDRVDFIDSYLLFRTLDISNYDFHFLDEEETEKHYVISFKSKKPEPDRWIYFYFAKESYGKLYINKADFAFTRVEFIHDSDILERNKFSRVYALNTYGGLFYVEHEKLDRHKIVVEYAKSEDGIYRIKEAYLETSYDGRYADTGEKVDVYMLHRIKVTGFEDENPVVINNSNDVTKQWKWRFDDVEYNTDFWEENQFDWQEFELTNQQEDDNRQRKESK